MRDFVIPTSKDDLLNNSISKGYTVEDVCSPSQLNVKLNECREAMQKKGMHFILDHFDSLFSVIVHFPRLDPAFTLKTWEFIFKAYNNMIPELESLLENRDLSADVRIPALNATKMTHYLLIQFMRAFQDRPAKYIKEGRGKKQSESDEVCWPDRCHEALIAIYNCLQLPLRFLWDPPCSEDSFADLVGSACLTALEDTGVTLAKMKPMRESICQIFGTLVKHYNYGFSMIIRIGQMLNRYEHVVSPMVRCVVVLHQEYECHSIVHEVIQELARIDPSESEVTPSSGRSHAQFIVELAECIPKDVAPHVKLLLRFLDMEPYTMRNAVLTVAGLVVQGCLTGEDLTEERKNQRDELLDHLTEHMLDVNAYVRSKVLQIWRRLLEEQAIPIRNQGKVLKIAVGRLKDKSSSVKKCAIQLVAAFLKQNPFAAKLGKDMEKQLETERKLLEELELEAKVSELNTACSEKEKEWHEIEPKLEKVLQKEFDSPDEDQDEEDSDDEGNVLPEDVVVDHIDKIRNALQKQDFRRAYKLIRHVEEHLPQEVQVLKPSVDVEGQMQYYIQLLRNIFVTNVVDSGMNEGASNGERKETSEVEDKVANQRKLVEYLEDKVTFMEQMNNAIPAICQLLRSVQAGDVVEAVEFFVIAHQFGLPEANKCISYLLSMVLQSHDKNIASAVSEACKQAYLTSEGLEGRAHAEHVVNGLICLLKTVDVGQFAALEKLIGEWVTSGALSGNCVHVLWETFLCSRPSGPQPSDDDCHSALVLLDMVAAGKPDIVKSHALQLVSEGLGPRGERDYRLVSVTCRMLQRLAPLKQSSSAQTPALRFSVDHEMFVHLMKILEDGFSNLNDQYYSPMVVDGINLIYHLCREPETLAESLVRSLCKQLLEISSKSNVPCDGSGEPVVEAVRQCDVRLLLRFVLVVGHVALRHTMYLDESVYVELKRRRNLLKEKEEAKKKSKKKKKASDDSQTRKSVNGMESELQEAVSGTQAEDREAEAIRNICETELVTGDTLLGVLSPVVVSICSDMETFKDPMLQRSAFLSLSKMMMVSSVFCSDHMQLFVTALSSSNDEMIRAHSLVAMADIAFRFPNVVEPWTSYMYGRLSDASNRVRQTAVMIMTHLVMNDMVKIKSQISDLALCTIDPCESIANSY
ncbi:condensin complex subunit 1 isoform X2 [Anabrus simplex]|uniref:condensin complex subunit 1 isoform X2 n=1 Tax=Anabrus simplex TaxID=316456 RepID=UPI0035A2DE0A